MTFQPMQVGPQNGAPPSLEFVSVDRLEVDPAYQRATDGPHSQKIIVGMVKCWDWSLCQPLVVSRRPDGRMMILDGQHRHAGAKRRGDIAHLPCVVLAGIDVPGEAKTFVNLNTKRQRLSQADVFNGMLAAGDENAKETAEMIAAAGWRIVRSSSTDAWKPGDLHCAPMLADQRRIVGDVPVRSALQILRRAYPETTVTCTVRLLMPLISICRGGIDATARRRLQFAVGSIEPGAWMARGTERQLLDETLSRHAAVAAVMVEAAAAVDLQEPKPLPPQPVQVVPARPPAPEPVATPPANGEARFGTSGKGWCDQCETLVSRDRATACRDSFCKMRAAA